MRLKCARYVFNSCYHRNQTVRYWFYQFNRDEYSGIQNNQMIVTKESKKKRIPRSQHRLSNSRSVYITTITQWYLKHFVYPWPTLIPGIFILIIQNIHNSLGSVCAHSRLREKETHSPPISGYKLIAPIRPAKKMQ